MKPVIYLRVSDANLKATFEAEKEVFTSLIKAGETHILDKDAKDPDGCIKSFINDKIDIYVKVAGLIDISLEVQRIEKKQVQLQKLLDGIVKKMSIADYETKVPEKVKAENLEKKKGYEREIEENKKGIERLSKLI